MKFPASPASAIDASNALTYGSLFAGMCALAAALQGNAAACGALLAGAVVFDTFDGRFARRVRRRRTPKGTTASAEIGTQLDSLVDAVTFGLVPVVCATVLFHVSGAIWFGSMFLYVACAVTRLGYFNITHENTDGFIGLPAPVAALLWSSLFLFEPAASLVTAVAITAAMAMIAPMPVPRPTGPALAMFVSWPVGLIVAYCARLLG
jgi:phosphatidylserine synthase